ncbi:MAG: hypothetical protein ACRCTW_07920, partial [Lactococcus garvieae]
LPDRIRSDILLYADDLKLWNSEDADTLQMDVDSIVQWSLIWKLPLNANKCVHLSLGGNSGKAFILNTTDGSVLIENAQLKKELGIWLSSNLKFTYHYEMAASKAMRVLWMIRRIFPRIPPAAFITMFSIYIRPHLEYASSIVYSGLVKDQLCLERVQRKATKLVRGMRSIPYETRLSKLGLFPLTYRQLRGDMLLIHSLFLKGEHGHFFKAAPITLRGHEKKLFVPHTRTFCRKSFFSVRAIQYWNSLPGPIVSADSKDAFKKLLDKYLRLVHSDN